jgi:feruloyl esterase
LAFVFVVLSTVGATPWLGATRAMECSASAFESLGLADEAFGQPVSNLTATMVTTSPQHCDVRGTLWPEIGFAVMLPTSWNDRLYMVGNGGAAGNVPISAMQGAVRLGYAAVGTDTGHSAAKESSFTFAWVDAGGAGANPFWEQKLHDFAYRSVHETAVVAKKIANAYYGRPPAFSYWVGCSTGGRQGLMEAQRYPADFDGIVAGAPVNKLMTAWMGAPAYLQPQLPPGSQIPSSPDALEALGKAVLAKCDGLDGLVDGLIDDPRKCAFDPDRDLPCSEAACFTAPQRAALQAIYAGATSNGTPVVPGVPKGSEAFPEGWARSIVAESLYSTGTYRLHQDAFRFVAFEQPRPEYDFLRDWDFRTDPPKLAARGRILEAVDPDLSAFRARGGKLLMYHGWGDTALNPSMSSLDYYGSVLGTLGEGARDFVALYLVPGMAHCTGGVGFGDVDWVTPVVGWVEDGAEPHDLVGRRFDGSGSRPVCRYPEVARHVGPGGVDDPASFACRIPLEMTVRLASINSSSKAGTASVRVWADITAPLPAADDLIMATVDGIRLFARPFSAFKPDRTTGNHVLSESGLVAWLNFRTRRFLVVAPKVGLSGLDPADGVEVELFLGDGLAVENVAMTQAAKDLLVYRRRGVTGDP